VRTSFAVFLLSLALLIAGPPPCVAESQPGLLGVEMRDLTKEEAEKFGWDSPVGVWVVQPKPGTPAEAAGILANDVILSVDGIEVENKERFRDLMAVKGAGAVVKLRIQRQGRSRTVSATLAARPAEQTAAKPDANALRLMLDTGGHSAVIKGMAFTPDGKFLVTAGEDKTIRIWDWRQGETVRIIRGEVGPGPDGKIYAMALSPDGRFLAVGGYLGAYEGTKGKPAPDEDCHKIRLYDFATGEIKAILKGHTNVVNSLAFSPDSTKLVSGGFDTSAIVWDVASGAMQRVLLGHKAEVYAVAFSLDGRRVVSGSYDNTLKLWDAASGDLIADMTGHKDKVYRVAVNPVNGTILSGSNDHDIREWDGTTGAFRRVLAKAGNEIGSMAFSRDGKQLLIGTSGLSGPWPCHLFDPVTGKQRMIFKLHDNGVFAAAMSPDGKVAVTADFLGRINLWDPATGQQLQRPDGQALTLSGSGAPRWSVAFSPDGTKIAWGDSNANSTGTTPINRRGPLDFELRLSLNGATLGNPAPLSSPDESFLRATNAVGSYSLTHRNGGPYGGSAYLDIVNNKKTVATMERSSYEGYRHRSYTFTPDGQTIISGGDSGVLLAYDLSGKKLGEFLGHESEVWSVATSPDGRFLISGSADQTVRLWNLKARKLIMTLFAERRPDGSPGDWLAWTPQGYFAGSPGADRLIGWQLNKGFDRLPEYFNAGQLRRQFNRPDIVDKAIELASAEEAVRTSEGTGFKLVDLITRPPPRVKIAAPVNLATVTGGPAELQVHLDPVPDPVKRVSVRVNGRVVIERIPRTGEQDISLAVPLAGGQNAITVVAGNDVGDTTAEVRLTNTGPGTLDKRGTLYVVAVGVDKYPNLNTCGHDKNASCNLTYSGRDASLFAKTIVGAMGPSHANKPDVTVLTNEPGGTAPTASNVLRALSRVRNLATETDTLVLFMAGHGVNDGIDYLFLASDAIRQGKGYDGATVVPWAILESTVFGTKGERYLFVDTCRSAGAFNAKLGNEAYHNDVTAFTATGQDESSVELSALQQGVFTYAIAQGLGPEAKLAAGADHKVVRASDLAKFLANKASSLIDEHWPDFEAQQKTHKPIPHLYQARDAEDHVLTRLE